MSFKTCSHCSQKIPAEANFCPYCTKPTTSRFWIWIRSSAGGIILGAILMGLVFFASQDEPPPSSGSAREVYITVVVTSHPEATDVPVNEEPLAKIPEQTFVPIPTYTSTPVPASFLTPTPTMVITRIASKDGMIQVYVPAGVFTMGSNEGDDNEKPAHNVYLDDFWIDETEVTNTQYALCVADGACRKPLDLDSKTSNLFTNSQYANYPVVFVDWNQANAYCDWAGRRLPTEAEWEKAARGLDERIYPWGNDFGINMVNFCDENCWGSWKEESYDDGYANTSPVGSYPAGASPYGALDMAGNVYEWVLDWFGQYASEYQSSPSGPVTGVEHVLRGGSWGDDIFHLRTTVRSDESPDLRRDFIGFRCAD
jgi:eukaryotic-like serine/threonine-protein kinase